MSTLLEKSLDEIISARPVVEDSRRGRGSRRGNNARHLPRRNRSHSPDRAHPYGGEPREEGRERDREREPRLSGRWIHDRYDDAPQNTGRRATLRTEGQTRVIVSNLHYELSEQDIRGLFEKIAPVTRFLLKYDRSGRSQGIAYVTYDYADDAQLAVEQYDGANAYGQPISVDIERFESASVPLARRIDGGRLPRGPPRYSRDDSRERRTGRGERGRERRIGRGVPVAPGPSRERRPKATVEDLDAQLDGYMNSEKPAKNVGEGEGEKPRVSVERETHENEMIVD